MARVPLIFLPPVRGRSSPFANHRAYKSALAMLVMCLAIAACYDIYYGVGRRSAKFSPAPDDACVVKAVSSIDGMHDVAVQLESGSRPITRHGLQKADEIHRFRYEYRGIQNNFYFSTGYDGLTELCHFYGGLTKPSQENVDALLPAMLEIEDVLQAQCGMTGLKEIMRQHCSGVRCGSVTSS